MNKNTAIGVLCGFSILALALAYWGLTDIQAWLAAAAACKPEIAIDTSSFWFLGAASIAGFPLLAVTASVKAHKAILASLVIFSIAIPTSVHYYFTSKVTIVGYDTSTIASPFSMRATVLTSSQCQ